VRLTRMSIDSSEMRIVCSWKDAHLIVRGPSGDTSDNVCVCGHRSRITSYDSMMIWHHKKDKHMSKLALLVKTRTVMTDPSNTRSHTASMSWVQCWLVSYSSLRLPPWQVHL
jgi:hypothetical protein